MIHLVYSVFDRKVKEYGQLVFAKNDEAVIRAFGDSLFREPSLVSAHPRDYDMMVVGQFDDETGELARVQPRLIINAAELMERIRAERSPPSPEVSSE